MTGSVIHRTKSGDVQLSWEEADLKAGFRLDRRKRWAFIDSQCFGTELCDSIEYTYSCSGCTEHVDFIQSPDRGTGCKECGYHGVVRNRCYVPYFRGEHEDV